VTARLIPLSELTQGEIGAWRELAGRAASPNPFFDPDYVLPAAHGLDCFDRVGVVIVEDGGEWAACMPVRRYARWHRLPLPCVGTWRHRYCLLGTPLLSTDAEDGVLTIADSMREAKGSAFAALEWVPAEGPIAAGMDASTPAPIPFEEITRAMIVRRRQNDYLDGKVKGKHRREFRRLSKGLEEEVGGPLELVDRAGDPAAVEDFLALEASGWKGRTGTALAAHPAHADFFREMTARMAARGALELTFLAGGGRIAAARCSLVSGDGNFCFKVAFDEELKRFSPGRELELRLIDQFHDDARLQWMDSCADPDNELFNRLWPDRRKLRTVAYRSRGPLGASVPPALRAVAALRNRRRHDNVD
jgi:CelD/BcsL family acetyltransferase involved in cellulose biosynthesis